MTESMWNPDLAMGEVEIDNLREGLAAQVQLIAAAIAADRGPEQAEEALLLMADYLNCSTRTEERLMARSGYPEREGHAASHAAFHTRVAALGTRFMTGSGDISADMIALLQDWQGQHLQVWDRELATHLREALAVPRQ